jgi:hypothetical protein
MSTATGVVHPMRVTVMALANALPSPTLTSPTNSRSAPGGWPATWVSQLPGAPSGIRSTKPRSVAGTSWIPRAVGRYSLWLTISRVSPDRPSTNARASVHASVTAYVVTSSHRHRSLAASPKPCHTPTAATTTATGVPGPTRASM